MQAWFSSFQTTGIDASDPLPQRERPRDSDGPSALGISSSATGRGTRKGETGREMPMCLKKCQTSVGDDSCAVGSSGLMFARASLREIWPERRGIDTSHAFPSVLSLLSFFC